MGWRRLLHFDMEMNVCMKECDKFAFCCLLVRLLKSFVVPPQRPVHQQQTTIFDLLLGQNGQKFTMTIKWKSQGALIGGYNQLCSENHSNLWFEVLHSGNQRNLPVHTYLTILDITETVIKL